MVQVQNPQIAAVLPAVDRVLQMPAVQALGAQYGHTAAVHAIRSLLSEMRQAMLDGAALKFDLRCLENECEFIDQLAQLRLDASESGS